MTHRILVGTRKGTFIVEKDGGGWKSRLSGHGGGGVNYVARDPHTGRLWALLGFGHWGAKLSVSDDEGATWTDAPAQVKYPEGAKYLGQTMFEDATSDFGVGWSTSLRKATVLKLWVIGFGPNAIYVGTIPGGLFASRDGGASFELNLPLWNHPSRGGDLSSATEAAGHETKWFGTPASEGEFAPGIHSIAVDPRDPAHLIIAGSSAGVIETRDGGETWHSRTRGMRLDHTPEPDAEWGHDPHYVDVCRADPKHVWQQNHTGIYYSDDGAESWRKVSAPGSNTHFGFPIAADERDGRVAWVVPGRSDMQRMAVGEALFVGRTEDGGNTWTELRAGLPQAGAYDVVLRHALAAKDGAVAFGSTTGNLYVSEDRGDSWVTVGNNLPPIYSVRFA